jgi:hypothetical protein
MTPFDVVDPDARCPRCDGCLRRADHRLRNTASGELWPAPTPYSHSTAARKRGDGLHKADRGGVAVLHLSFVYQRADLVCFRSRPVLPPVLFFVNSPFSRPSSFPRFSTMAYNQKYQGQMQMAPTANMSLDAGMPRDAQGEREWKHGVCGCCDSVGFCASGLFVTSSGRRLTASYRVSLLLLPVHGVRFQPLPLLPPPRQQRLAAPQRRLYVQRLLLRVRSDPPPAAFPPV